LEADAILVPGRPSMSDEILTVQEVAALLKVADKTVYTMAQQGEIPAFKVRGQWRFRRADLDAWIAAQTKGKSDKGSRR
jgi:excisionase family DNA binding protein